MPQVSGIDVLQYLQLWPQMRTIPVIVVTARRLTRPLLADLDGLANVCEIFEKTASPRTVATTVRKMVDMSRLYRHTPGLISRSSNKTSTPASDSCEYNFSAISTVC